MSSNGDDDDDEVESDDEGSIIGQQDLVSDNDENAFEVDAIEAEEDDDDDDNDEEDDNEAHGIEKHSSTAGSGKIDSDHENNDIDSYRSNNRHTSQSVNREDDDDDDETTLEKKEKNATTTTQKNYMNPINDKMQRRLMKQYQKECAGLIQYLKKLETVELELRKQNEILAREALLNGYRPDMLRASLSTSTSTSYNNHHNHHPGKVSVTSGTTTFVGNTIASSSSNLLHTMNRHTSGTGFNNTTSTSTTSTTIKQENFKGNSMSSQKRSNENDNSVRLKHNTEQHPSSITSSSKKIKIKMRKLESDHSIKKE